MRARSSSPFAPQPRTPSGISGRNCSYKRKASRCSCSGLNRLASVRSTRRMDQLIIRADLQRSPQDRRNAGLLECAGKAQRRRRFDCAGTPDRASQSGVALHLPPHSKIAGVATECSPSPGPLSSVNRAGGVRPKFDSHEHVVLYTTSQVTPRENTRPTSKCRPGPMTRRRSFITLCICLLVTVALFLCGCASGRLTARSITSCSPGEGTRPTRFPRKSTCVVGPVHSPGGFSMGC